MDHRLDGLALTHIGTNTDFFVHVAVITFCVALDGKSAEVGFPKNQLLYTSHREELKDTLAFKNSQKVHK